ncbi:MAG: DsbA family protein [Rhodoferax sp.]
MSIKSLLMPAISQHLLSPGRQQRQRQAAERTRLRRGQAHQVHYFHQVDDPYSALAAAILPRLLARYQVELVAHVVGPPSDAAAPERAKLTAYSRQDAQRLATHFALDFHDPGAQPGAAALATATAALVAAIDRGCFAEQAAQISADLWRSVAGLPLPTAALPTAAAVAAHLDASAALRQRLGHYLGATFYYAGEWYWGIDRLYHLEQRLQALGAQRSAAAGLMCVPPPDLQHAVPLVSAPHIDFFFSLRSPYSAIVAPRVFALGRLTGAPVRLRYLLPMVMRGLPVPLAKRRYISFDAAREARVRGIAFGRLKDPLGRPTERGLALLALAERCGCGPAYLLSFMQGVWAEGLDAGSDRGLRRIAERAGLAWAQALPALQDETWRQVAEANRQELAALGLWGVPSFHVGDCVTWGQDRLWLVEQALLRSRATD